MLSGNILGVPTRKMGADGWPANAPLPCGQHHLYERTKFLSKKKGQLRKTMAWRIKKLDAFKDCTHEVVAGDAASGNSLEISSSGGRSKRGLFGYYYSILSFKKQL